MSGSLPHRRKNLLTGEWVLVSPHRTQRPWQGQAETPPPPPPSHDPNCSLCPGNERAGGHINPHYEATFAFENDFRALLDSGEPGQGSEIFIQEEATGTCRVLCFSPRHDLTLATMPQAELEGVIRLWQVECRTLGETWRWVQVFENKGAAMGASSPHPHGQVWACSHLPHIPSLEDAQQLAWRARIGRPLLEDVLEAELASGERVVCQNEEWVWLVPFWAVWPFEALLLPRRPDTRRLEALDGRQVQLLAEILSDGLGRYDRLFQTSFPYSMGWHGAPYGDDPAAHWILHAHFYPPLLRSATVRKFMVGFEMLGEAQRDITAEEAARRLREA